MKIGVVGLGYWGKKVAREYMELKERGEIKRVVLCDVIDSNVNDMKNECPDCEFVSDYRDMIDDVDGVHICTPNATHYNIVNDFISAGVNVLVEKPMTLKYSEARKLAYKAYNKNVVLAVGHIFRFNNAVRKVKEMYESGELGDLYYAKLQWSVLMESPSERDIVYDLAPHPFDILNFIINDWPVRISAVGNAYRRENYEEVAYINAEFEDGFIANIEVSWIYPEKIRRAELMGSKKFVRLEAVKQEVKIFDLNTKDWENLEIVPNNTILDEAYHFITAIKNKQTPINDGFNASENVRVLEATVRAMREGKTENLEW
ncbi:MAG: Gfo/Idh/MocA family oxidoreductase [Euryarchaeota archaeon]|nr:Gfo/Idh/MocA family oxidoreductase [Euryarchaeota archaeon]